MSAKFYSLPPVLFESEGDGGVLGQTDRQMCSLQ